MSDRTRYRRTEKELIDALGNRLPLRHHNVEEEDVKNVSVKKSQIRNGPASIQNFEERLREFRMWLLYTRKFLTEVEDQPEGRAKWDDQYLMILERHGRKLNNLLDTMLNANDARDKFKPINNVRVDLFHGTTLNASSLPRPLNAGLPEGNPEYVEQNRRYFEDAREFGMRIRALVKLMDDAAEKGVDDSLFGILAHIAEGEGSLKGNQKRRAKLNLYTHESGATASCPHSCGHVGVVEKVGGRHEGAELTRRGWVVYDVFQKLRDKTIVYATNEEEELGKVSDVLKSLFDSYVAANDEFFEAGRIEGVDFEVELPSEEDYIIDFDEVRELATPVEIDEVEIDEDVQDYSSGVFDDHEYHTSVF